MNSIKKMKKYYYKITAFCEVGGFDVDAATMDAWKGPIYMSGIKKVEFLTERQLKEWKKEW